MRTTHRRTTHRIAGIPCGRRAKWAVLALWIVIIAIAGPLAGKLTDAEDNQASSWLPGSAESTKVLDQQKKFQPQETAPAVVVYERTAGITQADQTKATADAQQFRNIKGVVDGITGPVLSQDKKALETIIPITISDNGFEQIGDSVDSIRNIAEKNQDGVSIHITGPGGIAADQSDAFAGIDGTLLVAALGVVIVILLLTYRSPVLWILPVITAVVSLATAQAVIYLLAKHAGLTVNAQSAGILTVLVFGAGTDYALLLVARYREELRRHEDRHEAMAFALYRAGPAIIASASTVALGMLCLLVAEMNSTRGLGPVAAIGVVIALLAMITLLPALLVIVSRWIFWPVKPTFGSPEPTERGFWARIGNRIAVRPRVVWVCTALALGAMAFGLFSLNASGLSNKDSFTGRPDSVVGEEVLSKHFPAGAGQPLNVIGNAAQAAQMRSTLENTKGISAVTDPVVKNDEAFLQATLTDPADSDAAKRTVERARTAEHQIPGADAKVGGDAAITLDIENASKHDNKVVIPLVLGAVFVILALLLRALVAPIILIATVVLSFAAALGISGLVFKYIFDFGGADTAFPLFVFVFLVALGIDYNIFLMTRVREEAHKVGTRRGALIGLAATGGVITSAGLVLAGTFSALATLPLVAFAEIGFAVAFGVLLDTLVVRSILVTSLNLDIGRAMWWPSTLSSIKDSPPPPPNSEQPAIR